MVGSAVVGKFFHCTTPGCRSADGWNYNDGKTWAVGRAYPSLPKALRGLTENVRCITILTLRYCINM